MVPVTMFEEANTATNLPAQVDMYVADLSQCTPCAYVLFPDIDIANCAAVKK